MHMWAKIEVGDVMEQIAEARRRFREERIHPPGFVLLGWASWMALPYQLHGAARLRSGVEFGPYGVSHVMGMQAVVDDTHRVLVKVLPELPDVRPSGPMHVGDNDAQEFK